MLPALSIAIPRGPEPVVAQLTMDTGLKGTVTAGVVVFGAEVAGVVGGVVIAGVVVVVVVVSGSFVAARTSLSAFTGCEGEAAGAIGVVGEVSIINSGFVVNLMKASWSVVGSPALLFDVSGIVKNQRFFDDLFLPHTEKMPYCFRDPPNFAQIHFFS
jgi:hypothetical protein